MGFRAFLVMDNKVARQAMAGNGRKWQKMAGNGGKWWKMVENGRKKVHRGYLVGNGVFACFTPFPYYSNPMQLETIIINYNEQN